MTKKLTTEALCDPAPVNVAPVAMNDAITAAPGDVAVLNVLDNDTDADGDALTITHVGTPQQGTAVLNDDGTITYTANADASGTDCYTYTVSDGNGATSTATITATFKGPDPEPVNTAPVAVDDAITAAAGDVAILDVLANDTDADGDALTITNVGKPQQGTAVLNDDGTITYTANDDAKGTDSYTYTVSDGNGGSATATITATFEEEEQPVDPHPANTAPVATDDAITAAAGDVAVLDVLANDTDADGDTLKITNIGKPQQGTAVLNDDGTITYTANDDAKGTDSYTYTVSDGNGGSATATITATFEEEEQPIDPHPVNTAPVAADDAITAAAGDVAVLNVLANDTDADGDTLTITNVGKPQQGTAVLNDDGTITYTANDDAKGTDSYTYTVSDGNGGSDTATITATFKEEEQPVDPHPANTAPVATDDAITAAAGDVAVLDVLANDTDADGDALTITNVGKPQQGTAVLNDDGTITYTANDDAKGTDSYTYTVSDGNGGSDTATITATFEEEEQPVDPHPANTAPVATDDSADTAQGEPIAIDVVANDTDADGDTLTVKAVGDAANGMTSIRDGKAIYTPNPDFCGTDSFDYTVIDGNGGEDTGRVTVTVEAGQVVGADPVDPKAPVVGEDSKDDNDTPVADEPADEKPKAVDPVDEQPVADTPVNDEPVGDNPVNDQPVADTPVSDQPVADAPKGDGGGSASGGDVIDNEFGGKDYFGTDGDDVLKGGAGNDGFLGSGGNDTINGGAGHNQIDYLGSSSEYAITRKGDTLSVVKPSGGTDTVSNVSGVYFFGDDVYKTVEEFGADTSGDTGGDTGDDASDDMDGDASDDDAGGDDHPVDGGGYDGSASGGDVIANEFGGKDYFGTDGNDVLMGGSADDGFLGSGGSDTIDGGAGHNQIDYLGSSSDYAITREGNTLTVVKPDGGTDMVNNVTGVYFFGDDVYKAVEEFSADAGGGDDGSDKGDDLGDDAGAGDHPVDDGGIPNEFGGKDYFGTDGDDLLIGGEGNDGFVGYGGNDVFDGGGGYNQVDYLGSSTDYTAGIADDGTIIVVKPNGEGTDAMVNIDGLYFAGDDVWTPVSDLGPIVDGGADDGGDGKPGDDGDDTPVIDCPPIDGGEAYGTDGFDLMYEDGNSYVNAGGSADLIFASSGDAVLEGGAGFDVLHANGASSDYSFTKNDDGSVTAMSAMDGTDTLVDMEAVYFAADDHFEMMSSLTGGGCPEVEPEPEVC